MRIFILLFVIILSGSARVFGQQQPKFRETPEENAPEGAESGKKKAIKSVIKNWYIHDGAAFRKTTSLDTLQDNFQNYHPAYKNSLTNSYTGNYGGPYLNNNFFKRDYSSKFYFARTREAYLLTPDSIKYFNTTTPFTLLDFSQSENRNTKNETRFNVLHSQNVTPKLNLTFRFDQARSDGQYNFQANKNNFVTLYSSYNSDKLNAYGGFIVCKIQNEENGGLLTDDLLLSGKENLIVRLTDTKTELRNTFFYTAAEYKVGSYISGEKDTVFKPFAGFIYSFEYAGNKKIFKEGKDADNSLYFNESFINPDFSNDSVTYNQITNLFQLKLYEQPGKKTTFGKRGFIGQEFVKITNPSVNFNGKDLVKATFPSTDWSGTKFENYTNIFVGGGLNRLEGNFWRWNIDGRIYLTGFKKGRTELKALITKPLIFLKDSATSFNIEGRIENITPDFLQQHFFSNHKMWNNDLKSEQRMTANVNFKLPSRNFEIGANYALINNYIFHDTTGIPSQTKNELLVVGAYLDKDFTFRNLHLRTRLLYQKASSEDYIHIPDFSAYVSLYYKMVLSKVLFTQLGVDTRYNTKYYADAYDPLTGLFYLQNQKKLGGYPYIDAYASLKLKRTRIFFLLMNVGSKFLNEEFYTTLHQPMNAMTFRLGVAWTFYN